ncbi:ATP-binding protein [Rhodococcus sp. HNM0563]|uniref:ATP-binding protein n=1 Tax=unclassified Rhodococcus (in: high G+C Gram-positive bacteria) TaxID=192944 RepID=UPI00146D6837|nr:MULTISPECIES: ATP-binding protein [unclassified Rhodococcus (in: high G+C Gram-positive bacteria)]MCK0090207.1 ATP-binding protein [Rhodococcus sp. F64268]NLU61415.1 ATP-binding protein [Rhodococcus sp. HNM0563]
MAKSASVDSAHKDASPTVELRVKADADQLSVLRAVAAAIALQHDLDLDTVEDVKLAVDEAATRLIVNSVELSTLLCSFQVSPTGVKISLSAPTRPDAPTRQPRSFGWHVLNSLTDSVSVSSGVDERGDTVSTIEMAISDRSAAR